MFRAFSTNNIAASLWCAFLISSLLLLPIGSQAQSLRNYKIKAGFIYRFTNFSDWPKAAFHHDPEAFNIGIIGDNPFADSFAPIINRPIDGRKLRIIYLPAQASPAELQRCQVIFINADLTAQLPAILTKTTGYPILTISDMPDFLQRGGMISFFTSNNRIRFAVHRRRAKQVGINFRAQMLKMADHVMEGQ